METKISRPGIGNCDVRPYFLVDIFKKYIMTAWQPYLPQAGTNHQNVFKFS